MHFSECVFVFILHRMAHEADSMEKLWHNYAGVFRGFDDLTLARWMSQTLSQLHGELWRLSHPLVGAYRLAAMVAHDRQIWHQRMVAIPPDFPPAECCRAPLLPMITRDVLESGLICLHCNGTAVSFEQITDRDAAEALAGWAEEYSTTHSVAHWDDGRRGAHENFDQAFENAATESERLLSYMGLDLAPPLVEHYPSIVWEDQDECLQVRPEDIAM